MDIMIDIESLSTDTDCVILEIGAVSFKRDGIGIVDSLVLRPTIDEQTSQFNRKISNDTLQWWSNQDPSIVEEVLGDTNRISYQDCMEKLYKFCWNRNSIWSNGAAFDIVVMESAWKDLNMSIPWPYYSVRDTRTLYEVAGVSLKDKKYKTVTTHRAIQDAEHQAIVVQDAFRILNKLKM